MVSILIAIIMFMIITALILKIMLEVQNVVSELRTANVYLRSVIEWLDVINSRRESETLEIYKDAMDRVMSKSIGQYEAIKQQRENGEPLDTGGKVTSKAENQKKQAEKIRKLREGKED